MNCKGLVVVISGPSGGGKSTICRRLCGKDGYAYSTSVTTRSPRAGEKEGVDYHFVTRAEFEGMLQRNELLEFSEHFDNLYGTPRGPVRQAVADGKIVVLEIDVNGADQILQALPEARRVFVLPPNRGELEKRLRRRGTEDEAALQKRLARAESEMARAEEFDLSVLNDHAERATEEVALWIESEVKRTNG